MNNPTQPAFPIPFEQPYATGLNGLTKREYFTAAALTGILQRVRLDAPSDQIVVAKLSVEIADETLKQLEGGENVG